MYVGDQITQCRRDTNNTDTTAISTEDFLRYLNFGQESLQAIILQSQSQKYQSEQVISIVGNQDAYSIADNVYMGDRIVNVEYSFTGIARDYHKIYERSLSYRSTYPLSYITSYVRRSGQILVQPMPLASQGLLRVTYERAIDRLEPRRGVVSASTISGSFAITSLTINTADVNYPPVTADINAMILTNPYICVSDLNGTVLAYNIPVSGYNPGSGVFTITGGTYTITQPTTPTAPAGSYITFGKYSTTHPAVDSASERYLAAYCNWKILGRDAASEGKAKIWEADLVTIKGEIMKSYSETDHDEDEVQISNPDLML
jgi:hypothetical protein